MSGRRFDFPLEIIKILLLQLPPPAIIRLCHVNKNFSSVCADDVAKRYFPKLQLLHGTWYNLIKNASTPITIPVMVYSSTFRPPSPLGNLLLNKFSTLADLWTIFDRFDPKLLGEGKTISDKIVKNAPVHKNPNYFPYFKILWFSMSPFLFKTSEATKI